MRVTVLTKGFPPQMSGIGDHTDHLSAELSRRGIAVTVVCAPPADPREAFDVRGVLSEWNPAAIEAAVAETKPDVVVWQYNPFSVGRRGIPFGAARTARALARTAPLVVFFHALGFPWGRNGARGLVWAITQRAQARGVIDAAAATIVTTERREADLKGRGVRILRRIPIGPN